MRGIATDVVSSDQPSSPAKVGEPPRTPASKWELVQLPGVDEFTLTWGFAAARRSRLASYAPRIPLEDLGVPAPTRFLVLPWHVPAGIDKKIYDTSSPGSIAVQVDLMGLTRVEWGRRADAAKVEWEHNSLRRCKERAARHRAAGQKFAADLRNAHRSEVVGIKEAFAANSKLIDARREFIPIPSSSLSDSLSRQRRDFAARGILPWAAFDNGHLDRGWEKTRAFRAAYAEWARYELEDYPSNVVRKGLWETYAIWQGVRREQDLERARDRAVAAAHLLTQVTQHRP